MTVRVAINGFGRIGRLVMRAACESRRDDIEIVGINDLGPVETNAHLLRYDSVHGRFPGEVATGEGWMDIGRGKITVTAERDPAKLPWRRLGVDVALECTGIFTKREAAAKHLEAGAKRVIISAPADGADLTVVMGVNHDDLKPEHEIISNASCTTNCLAPVAYVLHQGIGIERGYMTTIHSYTGDQNTVDTLHHGSAPGAGGGPLPDPDLDRGGQGGRAGVAGAQGQTRWHRDPGADRQRVADRLHIRRGPRNLGRRGQCADGRCRQSRTASRASSASTRRRRCRSISTTTRTVRCST